MMVILVKVTNSNRDKLFGRLTNQCERINYGQSCTSYITTDNCHKELQRDTTRSIRVNLFQNELMVEIYYKSLLRAIGKLLLVKYS